MDAAVVHFPIALVALAPALEVWIAARPASDWA